jgi:antitoxin (DNA-binding transcriptional repressor) of toxin-antitoxin stability system
MARDNVYVSVTVTELRANLYRLIDEVIETGQPLIVERNGQRVVIDRAPVESKLSRLVPHPDFLIGDPEDFVHLDWSGEWRP